MPEEDARRLEDVRKLLSRLDDIDAMFTQERATRDLHERLAAASADVAEQAVQNDKHTARLLRTIIVVVAVGLLIWTPFLAYGAVWVHERVRNTCYPTVVLIAPIPPPTEPWYCGIFPGTNHPEEHLP